MNQDILRMEPEETPQNRRGKKPRPSRTPREKKPTDSRVFWIVFASVTLVLVVALVFALNALRNFLAAYEDAQPKHAVEAVMDRYFVTELTKRVDNADERYYEPAGAEKVLEGLREAGFTVGEFETLESAAALLAQNMAGKVVTCYPTLVEEEKATFHIVTVEPEQIVAPEMPEDGSAFDAVFIPSTKIATVNLVRGKVGTWNQRGWQYDSLEIHLNPQKDANGKNPNGVYVTIPSTSKLILNGKEVGESYIKSREKSRYNDYLPEGVEGFDWCSYEVTDLYWTNTVSVLDRDGKEQEIVTDDKGVQTAQLNYSDDLKEKYGERMMKGMQEYAKYIQNDGALYLVRPYFDWSSMFWRNIYENPSMFVWDHTGYYFANESMGEFYAFDENTFACRITFDHCLKLTGKEDYVDPIDMIVFARKMDSNFYIYDRILL